jgi:hypothetical protein
MFMTEGFDNGKYFKFRMLERLETLEDRFHIRRTLNTHPKLVVLICLLSVIILLWVFVPILLRSAASLPEERHRYVFFYDLNTQDLFSAPAHSVPPIKTPSGNQPEGGEPAGVRAYVFQFPDNTDPNGGYYIGWLETQDPAVSKEVYVQFRTAKGSDWGKGMLVKRPEDREWTGANTPEGRAIIEFARKPDQKGRTPKPVYPK